MFNPNPLKEISNEKIKMVHDLRSQGVSLRKIAAETEISYRLVNRALKMDYTTNSLELVLYKRWS